MDIGEFMLTFSIGLIYGVLNTTRVVGFSHNTLNHKIPIIWIFTRFKGWSA
jgi:hypothetical protein